MSGAHHDICVSKTKQQYEREQPSRYARTPRSFPDDLPASLLSADVRFSEITDGMLHSLRLSAPGAITGVLHDAASLVISLSSK